MKLVTYLSFNGRCEEAFKHYERVLGGQIVAMVRGSDMPAGVPVPPDSANRIMHARLMVGDQLLMGGDASADRPCQPQGFCAHIKIDDPAEAERMFRALGEGGAVRMPLEETFWARRFGMLTDRFGVPWMINCEKEAGLPETSGTPFSVSRTFDVTKDTLWRCFASGDAMRPWWGPKGATIIEAKLDLQPGGRFHYGMRTADGQTLWGRFVYREIVPGERIVAISSFADADGDLARHPLAPQWPVEIHATFDFSELGRGQSMLTVQWLPLFPTAEERTAFESGRDSMRQGWAGTLDRLATHLATS